ncbi:MAG: FecR domain-containing protein [Pseudomonadota bacterium]
MSDINTIAAEWLVRLSDEDAPPSQRELAELERWRESDPRHRQAIENLQGITQSIESMPRDAAKRALAAHTTQETNWQSLAKQLCMSFAVLVPLLMLSTTNQVAVWLADNRTEKNEWRDWQLPDGSTLVLGGNSAIDVEFDDQHRTIQLMQGELLIQVAHDASRPLVVVTEHGRFTALGTRFIVQKRNANTVVTVTESVVEAESLNRTREVIQVVAGEQLMASAQLDAPIRINAERFESNWRQAMLVANGEPLSSVLDRIAQHHPGRLLFDDSELRGIYVTAVLPLDDPGRAMQLLKESLPITVSEFTPWVVRIEKQK